MASTTLEERIEIHESAEKGEASWRTARRLPWRQRTIQKWRRRGRLFWMRWPPCADGSPETGSLIAFLLKCAIRFGVGGKRIQAGVLDLADRTGYA